jgi:hypothetical protein
MRAFCRRLDANAISSHDRSTLEAALLEGGSGGGPGDSRSPSAAAAPADLHQRAQQHRQQRLATLVSPVGLSPHSGNDLRLQPSGSSGGGGALLAAVGAGGDMMALPSDLQGACNLH